MKNWLEGGGPISLRLASSYLSDERSGVLTPDETLIHMSPISIPGLRPSIELENIRRITMINCSINGVATPDFQDASYYRDDGLILCFSNTLSKDICNRLNKVAAIAIDDMARLKSSLDNQLGMASLAADCAYTHGHQRNHFLKHQADAWMDEFRLFWPIPEEREIYLPPGIGRRCQLD